MATTETRATLAQSIKSLAEKRTHDKYLVIKASGQTFALASDIDLEIAADHLRFTDEHGTERLVPFTQITSAHLEEG
jgi:hypothetical protein